MPVSVKPGKRKGKKIFRVVDSAGKVVATHTTKKKAVAQVNAINLTQLRKQGRKGLPPRPKKNPKRT